MSANVLRFTIDDIVVYVNRPPKKNSTECLKDCHQIDELQSGNFEVWCPHAICNIDNIRTDIQQLKKNK